MPLRLVRVWQGRVCVRLVVLDACVVCAIVFSEYCFWVCEGWPPARARLTPGGRAASRSVILNDAQNTGLARVRGSCRRTCLCPSFVMWEVYL